VWIGRVTSPGDIERELNSLNKALVSSFEKLVHLDELVDGGRFPDLMLLKRKANRAFHVAYRS